MQRKAFVMRSAWWHCAWGVLNTKRIEAKSVQILAEAGLRVMGGKINVAAAQPNFIELPHLMPRAIKDKVGMAAMRPAQRLQQDSLRS